MKNARIIAVRHPSSHDNGDTVEFANWQRGWFTCADCSVTDNGFSGFDSECDGRTTNSIRLVATKNR